MRRTRALWRVPVTASRVRNTTVAFARNPSDETWTAFDDHTVRKLNTDFASVVATVSRARLQPLLLFYEKAQ